MQEFVFTVRYEPESDPIADIFIEYPDVVMTLTSLSASVPNESIWHFNHITGPEEALAKLDDIFLDPTHCNECLDATVCPSTWSYELLSNSPTSRTVYAYGTDGKNCHSIPMLATAHLGDGLLYDAKRQGNEYRWRLLVPEDAQIGSLYDTLRADLKDGVSLDFEHLTGVTQWAQSGISLADLPYEQRTILTEAVERGYYETPRAITTQELATELDIPQSTVQYRLSRAEAALATEFAAELTQ
ncbi:transcriptional regulator [Halonotius terrestris]|uniref:Transcriptional regulator n=1 Tax=Halonotius terrestris TaxID=2487750 RepID=A0A8J8P8D3_9EURY|nr:helix-turn-helix domain-containing protein [Halonotius terrestris]TQQ79839.1 transcriptional regulator [Halonotius terrestris]